MNAHENASWTALNLAKLFDAISGQPDMQYAMADATIVKVHRHGQGAELKAKPEATRAGHETKTLVLCNTLGNLAKFVL